MWQVDNPAAFNHVYFSYVDFNAVEERFDERHQVSYEAVRVHCTRSTGIRGVEVILVATYASPFVVAITLLLQDGDFPTDSRRELLEKLSRLVQHDLPCNFRVRDHFGNFTIDLHLK
jgi:hypothetical protein